MYAEQHYPFSLMPLPYAYSALEPYIDTLTMRLHHDRHLKEYVDNLNATLKGYPQYQSWSLVQLLKNLDSIDPAIRDSVRKYAGGVFNHEFFFREMAGKPLSPSSPMFDKIIKTFGSMSNFKNQFTTLASGIFGSGYAWLTEDNSGRLNLMSTANQDNPITYGQKPLLCLDVWEHAYYLKHYNLRADYIAAWLNLLSDK